MQTLQQLFSNVAAAASIDTRHLKRQVKELSHLIEHGRLMLDVGSGKSPYRDWFISQCYVCLDIDTHSGADIVGDICHLPFADGVADVVLCTEVVEHVPDPVAALAELNRVLKCSGYLILTVPLLIGVHGRTDYCRWTEEGLRLLVTKGRFDVLTIWKRGGIFSSTGAILVRSIAQVLGPFERTSRNGLKYGFAFLLYLLAIPLARLFIMLDILDSKRNFTLGYCVLARKP